MPNAEVPTLAQILRFTAAETSTTSSRLKERTTTRTRTSPADALSVWAEPPRVLWSAARFCLRGGQVHKGHCCSDVLTTGP